MKYFLHRIQNITHIERNVHMQSNKQNEVDECYTQNIINEKIERT